MTGGQDQDELARVRDDPDPVRRARLAGELIETYRRRIDELARLRADAINEANDRGSSFSQIADQLGLTRGRISQIRRSAQRRTSA